MGNAGPPAGNQNRREHGLYLMKRALKELGSRAIDRRTTLGRELHAWREEVIADLGGVEILSAQQLALIDLSVRQKLLLDSIDAYLLELGSLVNKRKRAVWPVLRERQLLADALSRYLGQLGLEKKKPAPMSLSEYLKAKERAAGVAAAGAETTEGSR